MSIPQNSNIPATSFKISEQYAKLKPGIEVEGIVFRPSSIYENISSRGVLYSNLGTLVYRGTNGTFTIIAEK